MNVSHLSKCVKPRHFILFAFTVVLVACQTSGSVDKSSAVKGRNTLEILQRDSQFVHNGTTVWSMDIQINDTVIFRNDDDVTHSLFSESEVKPFNIGQTRRGESGRVVFENPGTVTVKCEFHSAMRFELNVKPAGNLKGK